VKVFSDGWAVRANITPSKASQPGPHILVRSFGRFDEITDLVENASRDASPSLVRCGQLTRPWVSVRPVQRDIWSR
jgi:hypothetical protein